MRTRIFQTIAAIGIALAITATVVGLCWFGLTKIEVPQESAMDWPNDSPNGGSSDGDCWRSGKIFGMSADRIRRVSVPAGGLDGDKIIFYMSVKMSDREFEAFYARLTNTKDYEFEVRGSWPRKDFKLIPYWFAPLTEKNFVGFAKDDIKWWVHIFRPPGSEHVFFVLS